MAGNAHSTRLRAVVPHLPRAALEDLVERCFTALDAIDPDADLELDADVEPDCDEEDDCEASAQSATLAPDWLAPAKRHALRAVRS